jgi:hypothetical protein
VARNLPRDDDGGGEDAGRADGHGEVEAGGEGGPGGLDGGRGALASATSARSFDIPAALPPVPISVGWHARYDADPEHRWLRSQVQDIASELAGTAASSARVQSR